MSGNFPLALRTGDLLPSSWYRYFSLFLRTLDTVLVGCQERNSVEMHRIYLRSTPNMATRS
jgi:hypothetical protein